MCLHEMVTESQGANVLGVFARVYICYGCVATEKVKEFNIVKF